MASVDSGTYTYSYDQQNRRVKKAGGGATTHCLWEGSKVIAEHNGSTGALQVAYFYAGSRMIAKRENGQRRYFLRDRLSVRLVLDGSGNIIGRQNHLPFGEEVAAAGEQDKHRFTSYGRDGETGLDYVVNRGYSPIVGRFQSSDPYQASGYMTVPQSWNRYTYVGSGPINLVDPSGLLGEPPSWVICPDGGLPYFGECIGGPGTFLDSGGREIGGQPRIPRPPIIPPIPIDHTLAFRTQKLRDGFSSYLGNNECTKVLQDKGWMEGLRSAIETVTFYDVNTIAGGGAFHYFGSMEGLTRESTTLVGTFFSQWERRHRGGAITVPSSQTLDGRSIGGTPGIYTRGGVDAFFVGADRAHYSFLLHELVHYMTGRSDQALAGELGITREGNETWSQAVSRWFNNNCKPKT